MSEPRTRYRVWFYRRLTGERGILRDGLTHRAAQAYARRVEKSRPVATEVGVEPYTQDAAQAAATKQELLEAVADDSGERDAG